MRRREAGFSLMEVLVGLTLLALISLAVSQTMRTGLRLWQASGRDDAASEALRTSELIEGWVARALPPKAFDPDVPAVFVGKPDQMSFLLDGQTGRKLAGYSRVTLMARASRDCEGQDLVLVWEDVSAAADFAGQASDARTLLKCAETIKFQYAGPRRSVQGTQLFRSNTWNEAASLPLLVSVQAAGQSETFDLAARLRFAQ